MTVHIGPMEFTMGSPPTETDRDAIETQRSERIPYSFAIAAHEVTVEQYLRFDPHADYAGEISTLPSCPINKVNWYDAVRYCRWLSEQEEVPNDQMCYPELDRIGPEMELPKDFYSRSGYRLPTEAEWEYSARAGAATRWCFGDDPSRLPEYAWVLVNSKERTWPVGTLKPNVFGLFDCHGNVSEWCQELSEDVPSSDEILSNRPKASDVQPGERLQRGGYYRSMSRLTRSAKRFSYPPEGVISTTGFRVARTLMRSAD